MSDDAVAVDITPWEIYRNSAVGISLTNALNSMLENGEISTDQALLVLDEYDRWFQLRLRDNLAVDGGLRELSMHGRLSNYTCSEDNWRVDVTDMAASVAGRRRSYRTARLIFTK